MKHGINPHIVQVPISTWSNFSLRQILHVLGQESELGMYADDFGEDMEKPKILINFIQ